MVPGPGLKRTVLGLLVLWTISMPFSLIESWPGLRYFLIKNETKINRKKEKKLGRPYNGRPSSERSISPPERTLLYGGQCWTSQTGSINSVESGSTSKTVVVNNVWDSGGTLIQAVFRNRINWFRIRIQHFWLNTDPDPDSIRIEGLMTKNWKIFYFFSFLVFWGFFFYFFSYYIQHCFICRPSDSTVPTDAGIEPRTVAIGALTVRRSNH